MELKDCEIGKVVITSEGEIGHIIGFTYTYSMQTIAQTSRLTQLELNALTIPLVRFPLGDRGINHKNITLLK